MSNNILFVFEGEKTEKIIVKSLEKHILNGKLIIKCAYASDIYELYRNLVNDEDLDTFNLVKERNIENKKTLKNYTRKDFAEIYLFFDYDAHATLAGCQDRFGNNVKDGDKKLKEMLSVFEDESENGKLYISYPMVEALRHIIDFNSFSELTVKCKGDNCTYREGCQERQNCKKEPHYKTMVTNESITQLCNINGYTKETWKQLIKAHLSKMNFIMYDIYSFPQKSESQLDIFTKQFDKYINKQCPEVAVLSAFPVFVHDYFGNEKTKKAIK
jgi:hypothetical protein